MHGSQCEAEHRVCSTCSVLHGEACSGALVHSRMADEFAAAAREPCEYERYRFTPQSLAFFSLLSVLVYFSLI
jgi:hypothetical protein